MRWTDRSLVRRLVVVTLAAGLVTAAVGVVLIRDARQREVRRDVASQMLGTAERSATVIDGRLGGIRSQLVLLASSLTVTQLDEEAGTELAVALRVSDELSELVLYDLSGRPVAAAASARLLQADELEPRPEVAGLVAGASRVRIAGETDLPTLELAARVQDPPGSTVGVLVGRVPLDLVMQEAEARLLSESASAFIVAFDGTIVGHRDRDRVLRREVVPLQDIFRDRRVNTVERDGQRVVLAAAPAERMPAWVVVEQPAATAFALEETAVSGVSVVLLAVVAAMVAAVIGSTRRTLRPLTPLADAGERLGAGERDVRVDEEAGIGEIRVLAAGFNRMAERLQQRQEDLEAAEQSARRSEERLRLMVEGVEDYAIFLLDLEGTIRTWNTGARRLLGTTRERTEGQPLSSFFDPSEPPPDPLIDARRTGRGESEGWLRRADDGRFWARIVATALRDEHDEPYGHAVVLHDLTDRRAARAATEEALEREQEASEELRRTNLLKDEFLAMAAHELQTPLSAILGASSILDELGDLEADDARHVRSIIHRNALDMRATVQRLLDFSRLQAGRIRIAREPLDLRATLEHEIELLSHQLRDHTVDLDAPPVTIELDPRALHHIVGNLLSNAAKFSPPGSRVDVHADVADHVVELAVVDRGIGIPPEDREAVFELFRQSSNELSSARGTGVGLAIVQRYVELLEGTVGIDSTPGEGTTFTIRVPLPSGSESEP